MRGRASTRRERRQGNVSYGSDEVPPSREALRVVHRKLIERHCFAGDRMDFDRLLQSQARLAHEQHEEVRKVTELLALTEATLSDDGANVLTTADRSFGRGSLSVESKVQPFRSPDMTVSDDDFLVRFRGAATAGGEQPSSPGTVEWKRNTAAHGAAFEFGSTSESAAARQRRWRPCFAELEKIEKVLDGMEGPDGQNEDDPSAPQAVSQRDKDEALAEGFDSEASELSAFISRWLEAINSRLRIASVQLAVSRHGRSHMLPSRAIQVGEPAAELQAVPECSPLSRAMDATEQEDTASSNSLEDGFTPFGMRRTGAGDTLQPFSWTKSVLNSGFLRTAERVACAIRVQAVFRGFQVRKIVGNVHTGQQTFFQAAHTVISKAWLEAVDVGAVASSRERGLQPTLISRCTAIMASFAASAAEGPPSATFADMTVTHFSEAFSNTQERWHELGQFLVTVNDLWRRDPLLTLVFILLLGRLTPEMEGRFCHVLLKVVKLRHTTATLSQLPLELTRVDDVLSAQAVRTLLKSCTSIGDHSMPLGMCHRRFWAVADAMVPSWISQSDFSTLRPLDRQMWRTLLAPPEEGAPERRLSMRQALLFSTIAFCL